MKRLLLFVIIIVITVLKSYPADAFWWMVYHKPAFKGKVIDAETREPIEGAVVVVTYSKTTHLPPEAYSSIINVRETLTDKNGEFYFPSYTTVIQPLSSEEWARFIIFKPGYGSFPKDYMFTVLPVKNVNVVKSIKRDQKGDVTSIEQEVINEGIVFKRQYKYWNLDERKDSLELNRIIRLNYPFLSLKDAESKVKNLEIPFDYANDFGEIPEDLYNNKYWTVWYTSIPGPFEVYTVTGLKKLKTREERDKALSIPNLPLEFSCYKIKNLNRLLNEEYKNLGYSHREVECNDNKK